MNTPELGLTFGQILALITVIGGILVAWINLNIRVRAIEVELENVKAQRSADVSLMEVNRKENREEHGLIMTKLDNLISNKPRPVRRQKT